MFTLCALRARHAAIRGDEHYAPTRVDVTAPLAAAEAAARLRRCCFVYAAAALFLRHAAAARRAISAVRAVFRLFRHAAVIAIIRHNTDIFDIIRYEDVCYFSAP